jgi:DNA-binding response OmpR family regulator
VLLVSPYGDEMDRILAFECGADDFARDPLYPRELASRVQALLRRGRRPRAAADEGETRVGPMRVDFRKSVVEMEGRPVPLTWREFEVLRLLAQERGRVVRRAALLGL